MLTGILVPISFFALVLGIVYLAIRKKERMAMIEKGIDPSIFVTQKKTVVPFVKMGNVSHWIRRWTCHSQSSG